MQKEYHIFQGDFLSPRSGVRSMLRRAGRFGVRLRLLSRWFADTDFDFDRSFSRFCVSRTSISTCRGVRFSFSSRRKLRLPSPTSGCAKASSQLMRSSSRRLRQRLMKSLDLSERAGSKVRGLVLMALMSWSSLLAGQGVQPWSISQQMSPTDQRSDLLVQLWWLRICGDMQSGVPTIDFRMVLSPWSRLRAKPKSLIFSFPSLMRMLAGFRSRCMMSLRVMYSNPRRMSRRKARASFSGSLFLRLRQVLRSPSSQHSVTMYMLLLVWQTSSRRTMFSCSIFFMISISQWMFFRLYWFAKMRLSITFTAAGVSSLRRRPRKTEAQEPLPSRLFIEQTYFSIFFSPQSSDRGFTSPEDIANIVKQNNTIPLQLQCQICLRGPCEIDHDECTFFLSHSLVFGEKGLRSNHIC